MPTKTRKPARGDVWRANLNPTVGHEQGGTRPVLIITVDTFNQGPAGVVMVIPISTKDKKVRSQVLIDPPEGGLTERSFAKCEALRSISTERLTRHMGTVSDRTVREVEMRLRFLLGL